MKQHSIVACVPMNAWAAYKLLIYDKSTGLIITSYY
jgi:hypothetical protein